MSTGEVDGRGRLLRRATHRAKAKGICFAPASFAHPPNRTHCWRRRSFFGRDIHFRIRLEVEPVWPLPVRFELSLAAMILSAFEFADE